MAAGGTTTALVYSSVHRVSTEIAFEAAEAANLRIFMGKVMMDQRVPQSMLETTAQSLKDSWELAQQWHGQNDGLLGYAFTPRFLREFLRRNVNARLPLRLSLLPFPAQLKLQYWLVLWVKQADLKRGYYF